MLKKSSPVSASSVFVMSALALGGALLGAPEASAKARNSGASAGSAPAASAQPEDVDVSRIKERYWTKGDESEVSVVQNRQYSKAHKLEIGFFGGALITDPFLSVHTLGTSLAYHFNEYWALRAFGWRSFVSSSQALDTLQSSQGIGANTNEPNSFYGGELQFSFLYGKLSILGKSIIYYDMHLLGGAGLTNTETGGYVTPFVGLGQQIWLTQWASLNLDFRVMGYNENLVEKVAVSTRGQPLPARTNISDAFTLGVSFLL